MRARRRWSPVRIERYAAVNFGGPQRTTSPCQFRSLPVRGIFAAWIAAFDKLYQTMLHNIYLVPHLLGENPRQLDLWHGSNWAELEYARELPQSLADLWDELSLAWANGVRNDPRVVAQVDRYIEIHRELKTVAPGPRRSRLVREASAMRDYSFAFAE